ncbi:hypothetical protein SBDP1_40026 [Syntrophobacter sp. SbD1]|nr:hypothetical protein SBDP1_40026 [Syntrophobacter sp. SbD1]
MRLPRALLVGVQGKPARITGVVEQVHEARPIPGKWHTIPSNAAECSSLKEFSRSNLVKIWSRSP